MKLTTTAGDHGTVISNAIPRRTWVNAIGARKFTEVLPNGAPIGLGIYRYSGYVRLPIVPKPDINQQQNPQSVHWMIQLWDGREALWPSNLATLEGSVYWALNPWETAEYGKIKVYVKPIRLADTGIVLPPDTSWHRFELVVDFRTRHYVSVKVDNMWRDLSQLELAQVYQPSWGADVSLAITQESLAAWPQANCTYIFWWGTEFRDLLFEKIE